MSRGHTKKQLAEAKKKLENFRRERRKRRLEYSRGYLDGQLKGYTEGYIKGLHDGNPFTVFADAVVDMAKALTIRDDPLTMEIIDDDDDN